MSKYQLFDSLTPEEYNSLRESIIAVGVRVPIVLCGDTGDVIDGHHRLKICEEQGRKDYPVEKVYGLSELEKRQMARSLNMARRHLTQEQRRKQIQDQLRDTPELSDRAIAASIGVTNKTVGVQRREMVRREEIPHVEKTIDSLGREQPRRLVSVINPTERQERQLKKPAVVERMESDSLTSPVYASRVINQEAKAARKNAPFEVAMSDIMLFCRDIDSELLGESVIKENSVDLILTDPPYGKQYLKCYASLSYLAERVLKPGGSLLCLSGGRHLNTIMRNLSFASGLTYYWTISYILPRNAPFLPDRKVSTYVKPIVWLTKGKYTGDLQSDILKAPPDKSQDKIYHEWGQNLEIFEQLVERFTDPGQLILDPFCGGGTTGVAAVKLRRKFIGFDISEECMQTTKKRVMEVLGGEKPAQ